MCNNFIFFNNFFWFLLYFNCRVVQQNYYSFYIHNFLFCQKCVYVDPGADEKNTIIIIRRRKIKEKNVYNYINFIE